MAENNEAPQPDVDFDLSIDRNSLDEEWLRQPKLYHEYALHLAEARLREDEAKQKLDYMQSELEKQVREDPEVYELSKSTESEIKACIIRQPEYRNCLKQLNKAKHRVGVLAAAVTAIDHKRRALENLVELHGQDYFSEPKAKTERGKAVVEDVKDAKMRSRVKFKNQTG